MTNKKLFDDQQFLRDCESATIVGAEKLKNMYVRLLCSPVKDMSFLELRGLQLLNEKGIGISGLIAAYSRVIDSGGASLI